MFEDGLTYDDVLLVPQYSEINSRSQVDVSVKIGKFTFSHPIILSNMKSIIGPDMALEIVKSGGLAVLHRFSSIEDQLNLCFQLIALGYTNNIAISVGVKQEDKDNLYKFIDLGIKIVCIDVAHGDSSLCLEMCKYVKEHFPQVLLIAGNVATATGAKRLWAAGADMVKCGIGPGSICSTRIQTGNGVPQLTAIMNIHKVKIELQSILNKKLYFIADGGLKTPGDIVKALCFADMVMTGNMFAGCYESPGKVITIDNKTFKQYEGSSTHKTNHIEGVIGLVPVKGTFKDILNSTLEGIKSGCSYQGVDNLEDLKDNPHLIKISSAGLKESHPHSIG